MADFSNYEDFWKYYRAEHSKAWNRGLHLLGVSVGVALALTGLITRRPSLVVAALVVGYAFAWFGHFVVERNKPATFNHPLWSLRAAFRMYYRTLTGRF